ncbi:hypothetical protein FA13DRAFT_1131360 [Coprinellus micaceus]|uniref:Uncharacterized protein n=1 Tax=Coprinellus micaceus TaxID=71717 RepID=A0A4Y7SVA1_COPMI|nr:hypothetical protein FA13DRAFT_1131360 [Coprinellus micaceus]
MIQLSCNLFLHPAHFRHLKLPFQEMSSPNIQGQTSEWSCGVFCGLRLTKSHWGRSSIFRALPAFHRNAAVAQADSIPDDSGDVDLEMWSPDKSTRIQPPSQSSVEQATPSPFPLRPTPHATYSSAAPRSSQLISECATSVPSTSVLSEAGGSEREQDSPQIIVMGHERPFVQHFDSSTHHYGNSCERFLPHVDSHV